MRLFAAFRASKRPPLLLVVKSALATVVAWLLAGWLFEGPPPVFAAIAALLVVQPSVNQSLTKAVERSVGVIAGVAIATVVVLLLGGASWVVLLAVVAALVISWALKMTSATANQVAISALLVIALGTGDSDYAVERVLETIIGAVIGIIVNVALVPPVALGPAHRAVDALGDELGRTIERLAAALEQPQSNAALEELLLEARLLRPMRESADAAIAAASESLTLNPRGRRHRRELDAVRGLLDRFGPIVTQVIGMTRAFYDRYDDGLVEEPAVRAIADQLRRAASDVRRTLRRTAAAFDDPASPPTASLPALTAPLSVKPPSSEHWILVGSLLEDLRRIHAALTEE